jgi:hypothetical protein
MMKKIPKQVIYVAIGLAILAGVLIFAGYNEQKTNQVSLSK